MRQSIIIMIMFALRSEQQRRDDSYLFIAQMLRCNDDGWHGSIETSIVSLVPEPKPLATSRDCLDEISMPEHADYVTVQVRLVPNDDSRCINHLVGTEAIYPDVPH